METIFPNAPGFEGFFMVGYRTAAGQIQRTGTVILKRTYAISASTSDPATGSVTPTSALPVFVGDQLASGQLRYEHDLATFKPEGDLLVLDFVTGAAAAATVRVANVNWLSRAVAASDAHLFGWQSRSDAPRKGEGAFPDNDSDYPLPAPLPASFNNRYFNGFLRNANSLNPLPYLPASATILVERGATRYGFRLGSETITARYLYYRGTGADEDCHWRTRTLAMNLDTLVVEPALNRCYSVWRGVWNFDEQDAGNYRRLIVEASEP
ncbi:MAG TPA: hypothetical protein PKE45_04040 [Caldilineaceae bacterium]|nr:hypothetical protein [Caldilineaceae bacterium]